MSNYICQNKQQYVFQNQKELKKLQKYGGRCFLVQNFCFMYMRAEIAINAASIMEASGVLQHCCQE